MKTRTIVHLIGKVKKKTALRAMLQGTLGWGRSRLDSDWYVQWSPLRVSSAFSISLSISNTSFSSGPLIHGWKIGRPALPFALLAKWNPFFSHKLLGRRYTFFFLYTQDISWTTDETGYVFPPSRSHLFWLQSDSESLSTDKGTRDKGSLHDKGSWIVWCFRIMFISNSLSFP